MSMNKQGNVQKRNEGDGPPSITANSLNAKVTYRRGAEALRNSGLLSSQDFRVADQIQDLAKPLPGFSPEYLSSCHKRMVQFHRGLLEVYPKGSRVLTSLVACHGKLTNVLNKGGLSSKEGFGALATTGEDVAMLLSQFENPSVKRASTDIIGVAANFCDKAVFLEQHESCNGLAGPIATLSRQSYCSGIRDLWRDGKIERGDPRLRLTDADLEAHPWHDLKAGDLVEHAAIRVRSSMDQLDKTPGSQAWGISSIERDIEDFRGVASKIRKANPLDANTKVKLHCGLMMSIGSMSERIALNLCQKHPDSPEAFGFFALSSTSSRRAMRYRIMMRQAQPREKSHEARQ